jgi:type II secretory pathway component PulM
MIDALAAVLIERNRRERWLLVVLVAVVLPLAVVALVLVPLREDTQRLRDQTREARDLFDWIGAQAAAVDIAALAQAPAPTESLPSPAPADVEASLAGTGLEGDLSRLSAGQDGRIELGFDAVAFAPALDWLQRGRPARLRLLGLRIERTQSEGRVRLDATLGPAP